MTTNKGFKRLVRERMQKTGESYATARLRLTEKRDNAERLLGWCAACGKHVAFKVDVDPCELSEPEIEGSTFVTAYRRVLECAQCGKELLAVDLEFEIALDVRAQFAGIPSCASANAVHLRRAFRTVVGRLRA